MLSADCKYCKNVVWGVAIGIGVRCNHPENQKYKEDEKDKKPVIISRIPENCTFKQS